LATVCASFVRDGAAVLELAVATACLSESLAAIRRGIQAALFEIGRVPVYHQTDNSTSATHQIARDAENRAFNEEYLALMRHFKMEPRTTAVGAKEQNGDVEASHRALKRRLEQALLVRDSRDFADQTSTSALWPKWSAKPTPPAALGGRGDRSHEATGGGSLA